MFRAPGDQEYVRSACFSPDNKYLATGSEDCKVRIWDLESLQLAKTFADTVPIYSVDYSNDGKYIATASGDNMKCNI